MLPPEVAGEGNPPDGDMVLLDDEGLTNKSKKDEYNIEIFGSLQRSVLFQAKFQWKYVPYWLVFVCDIAWRWCLSHGAVRKVAPRATG